MALHRTQVLLEPWQHEALKRLAKERDLSISAVMREVLASALKDPVTTKKALMDLCGSVSEEGWDLENLDEELYKQPWD